MHRKTISLFVLVLAATLGAILTVQEPALAQGGAKGKGGFGGKGKAAPSNLPTEPTAVPIPAISAAVTGPGPMYDSTPSLWPGHGLDHYNYTTTEYFITGTANEKPYKTRLVLRAPADLGDFSGLVIAESMHPAGFAHGFEFNSIYIMENGHIAADILTSGNSTMLPVNEARYADLEMSGDQTNEILAQVGALLKSDKSPLAGRGLRKMILFGTSASSFVLTQYLPAHMVYRTPEMNNIYDGFMPTSNGSDIQAVDVPMIQVPTQLEFSQIATAHQDSDEAGSQYRNYEFPGMGHIDTRNNGGRMPRNSCMEPLSNFPMEAYMSVALDHLFTWVDKGVAPPRAERALIDRNVDNDGALTVLDEHGNPVGGIRSPYVDVPFSRFKASLAPAEGGNGQLCRLSNSETKFSAAELRQMYGSKDNFVKMFEARLNELEAAGWSLPVYHDLLLADAQAVQF